MSKPTAGFPGKILAALAQMGPIRSRAMFGGFGLYREETFFAILWKGRLYLKSRSPLSIAGRRLKPFRPRRDLTMSSYFEVPASVLSSRPALLRLVRAADLGQTKLARKVLSSM